jgi:hypothetical protein
VNIDIFLAFIQNFLLGFQVCYKSFGTTELFSACSAVILSVLTIIPTVLKDIIF